MLGADNDRSLIQEYFAYLGGLFTGDLGVSVTYFPPPLGGRGPVAALTLILVGCHHVHLPAGDGAAPSPAGGAAPGWTPHPRHHDPQAVPYFWLALLFIYVPSVNLGLFPISGGYDYTLVRPAFDYPFLSNAVYYGFLPALTIVLSSLGGWLLGMRNMMVSTLSEDYILTAEAKGLPAPRDDHVRGPQRDAAQRSGFAISLGFVVSGSIVVETVFSYPGSASPCCRPCRTTTTRSCRACS